MARKSKDNKAHYSSRSKKTSTKDRKRPSKERGPYGCNNGTVQKRTENPHKGYTDTLKDFIEE